MGVIAHDLSLPAALELSFGRYLCSTNLMQVNMNHLLVFLCALFLFWFGLVLWGFFVVFLGGLLCFLGFVFFLFLGSLISRSLPVVFAVRWGFRGKQHRRCVEINSLNSVFSAENMILCIFLWLRRTGFMRYASYFYVWSYLQGGFFFRDGESGKLLTSKLGSSVGQSVCWLESKGDFLAPEKSSLNS